RHRAATRTARRVPWRPLPRRRPAPRRRLARTRDARLPHQRRGSRCVRRRGRRPLRTHLRGRGGGVPRRGLRLGTLPLLRADLKRSGMRLEGRIAVITGTAAGIGRATALRFAEEGAAVVGADVSEDANAETARLVEEAGGKMIPTTVDVTEHSSVAAMFALAEEQF